MPLPIIADTYRCTLNWVNGGMHAVNVLHIRRAASNAAAVATALDANVTANMWDAVQSSSVMSSLVVTPLDGSSATYTLPTSGAKWTGRTAGDMIPQEAQVISFRTALRGPRNRGRLYLPFIGEGSQTAGAINAASLANSQPAWSTWLTAMITAAFLPVVASYVGGTAPAITSVVAEGASGTQRRRQTRNR